MTARLFLLLALVASAAFGCSEEEEERSSTVRDLRVLALSAEPADMVLGETMVLEALVTAPEDDELRYQWEWCPFTEGADDFFDCPVDEENPELAELFDLGTEETAALDSVTATLVLEGICDALSEGLDDLGEYEDLLEYIDLPNCDLGMDVTIRLTVSSPTQERIAIKRVFIWLSDPEPLQRNRNPVIDRITVNDEDLPIDTVLRADAQQDLGFYVDVPGESLESYLLRSDPNSGERRETITYNRYATRGLWGEDPEQGSFADDEYVLREDAGQARLEVPNTQGGDPFDAYFVVRDDRGGIAWATRQVQMSDLVPVENQ